MSMRRQEIRDLFIALGWKKKFIRARIRRIPPTYSNEKYIKKTVESWFPVNASDLSFTEIFRKCGLHENVIKDLLRVITPLYNTCYSTFHLYDIAMEYLFEKQNYQIRFSSTKNFIKSIKQHA